MTFARQIRPSLGRSPSFSSNISCQKSKTLTLLSVSWSLRLNLLISQANLFQLRLPSLIRARLSPKWRPRGRPINVVLTPSVPPGLHVHQLLLVSQRPPRLPFRVKLPPKALHPHVNALLERPPWPTHHLATVLERSVPQPGHFPLTFPLRNFTPPYQMTRKYRYFSRPRVQVSSFSVMTATPAYISQVKVPHVHPPH
jgi:hypothetical protein